MRLTAAIDEAIREAEERNYNQFSSFRGAVDRAASHAVVEQDTRMRHVTLNLLILQQVYDERLDQAISEKVEHIAEEKIKDTRPDDDTPKYVYMIIADVVSRMEYRSVIREKSGDQIDYRQWVGTVDEYCERIDISPQDRSAAKKEGVPILVEAVSELNTEIKNNLEDLNHDLKESASPGEMVGAIQDKMVEIDSQARFLGEV